MIAEEDILVRHICCSRLSVAWFELLVDDSLHCTGIQRLL